MVKQSQTKCIVFIVILSALCPSNIILFQVSPLKIIVPLGRIFVLKVDSTDDCNRSVVENWGCRFLDELMMLLFLQHFFFCAEV